MNNLANLHDFQTEQNATQSDYKRSIKLTTILVLLILN